MQYFTAHRNIWKAAAGRRVGLLCELLSKDLANDRSNLTVRLHSEEFLWTVEICFFNRFSWKCKGNVALDLTTAPKQYLCYRIAFRRPFFVAQMREASTQLQNSRRSPKQPVYGVSVCSYVSVCVFIDDAPLCHVYLCAGGVGGPVSMLRRIVEWTFPYYSCLPPLNLRDSKSPRCRIAMFMCIEVLSMLFHIPLRGLIM